jgi:hypothetical protein
MKKIILILVLILNLTSYSQNPSEQQDYNLFKPNYPDGIYKTKEDFIRKIPFQKATIIPKGLVGSTKPTLTELTHNCFFFYSFSDEKINDAFAISYKGHLYFQIKSILKYKNKRDNSESHTFPNSYVKVIIGGENYFYTEADLANSWSKGLAYGSGGSVGGVIGSSLGNGKGIVWDFKNKEFNIFSNCKDFNEFITDKYSKGIQECSKNQPDILKIREAIEKIK